MFDIKKYASIFQTDNFTYLFAVKIISGFPIGIFQSMFSIFAMEYFHLKAKENGMVLSYVGIMSMVSIDRAQFPCQLVSKHPFKDNNEDIGH